MKRTGLIVIVGVSLLLTGLAPSLRGEVCNLKVVTDASPDYTDLPSLVHSVTAKWPTTKEKCWAMFHWNFVGRRASSPMWLHGVECADPIRQFNDYGFAMCSTMAGVNQSIWEQMGLPHKFYDIRIHTVGEVFYDDGWHMYDDDFGAIYTLCDGKTVAAVEDIGVKSTGCAASGGKEEQGHIAKYHCLYATSPNGSITSDGDKTLADMATRFKFPIYRPYYFNWDYGHRYILNLKEGEVYTRYYKSLGDDPKYWVPNKGEDGKGTKDPESFQKLGLRGNGTWTFKPPLTAAEYKNVVYSAKNIAAAAPSGLQAEKAGAAAGVIFKVQAANVVCGQTIAASFARKTADDAISISISDNNGITWQEVWKATDATGEVAAKVELVKEVSGAYEILVKVAMQAKAAPADAALKSLEITTFTEVNAKALTKLTLGKNTVYVGAGEQTESIVFWPDLQNPFYKKDIVEEKNIIAKDHAPGYLSVLYPKKMREDGYLVYRVEAPSALTRVTYGGRFYNRALGGYCELHYSFDNGKTWTKSWELKDNNMPWDRIHFETLDKDKIPAGATSVLLKFLMNTSKDWEEQNGMYGLRIEANYAPPSTAFKPMDVTFAWSEVQKDRTLVKRSHTQLVDKLPFKYSINVGGEDYPVMESQTICLKGAQGEAKYSYSDGKDAGGEKFLPQWVTYGKNVATGKKYTLSDPPNKDPKVGDPNGTKLTDGVVGPTYSGSTAFWWGVLWNDPKKPLVVTLDLGEATTCASFGMNVNGYPFWDPLKGTVQDKIEVSVSDDGKEFKSVGYLKSNFFTKEVPVNYLLPQDGNLLGFTARLIPEKPVKTRYVKYTVENPRSMNCITELEVLDSIKYEPFDLRIALPDENPATQPAEKKP